MRIRKSRLKCNDEDIVELYERGLSLSEITEYLPVSISGAWKVLKMYKIKSRPRFLLGEKHKAWKGDSASRTSIHTWLYRNFGSAYKCENPECKYPRKNARGYLMVKPKGYEWANVKNHIYTRKREDYKMLCCSCHGMMDKGKIKIVFK